MSSEEKKVDEDASRQNKELSVLTIGEHMEEYEGRQEGGSTHVLEEGSTNLFCLNEGSYYSYVSEAGLSTRESMEGSDPSKRVVPSVSQVSSATALSTTTSKYDDMSSYYSDYSYYKGEGEMNASDVEHDLKSGVDQLVEESIEKEEIPLKPQPSRFIEGIIEGVINETLQKKFPSYENLDLPMEENSIQEMEDEATKKDELTTLEELSSIDDTCQILDDVTTDSTEEEEPVKKKKKRTKSPERIPKTPFSLVWAFGYNIYVPVLNLTLEHQTIIAYAASHVVILYDYLKHKMATLEGHTNSISSISADSTGEWLATADLGINSSVIVWNVKRRLPIYTKFNKHLGYRVVQLSPCGKYLVTVTDGEQNVMFLQWALSQMTESGMMNPEGGFGDIKKVTFANEPCKDISFCLTSNQNVCFVRFVEYGVLDYNVPTLFKDMGQVGNFTDTVYTKGQYEAITSTDQGYVLMWRDEIHSLSETPKKELVNYYNLNPNPINCLALTGSWIVMGDSSGILSFYDQKLNFHYCSENLKLGTIGWLDFNRRPRNHRGPHRQVAFAEQDIMDSNEWEKVKTHPKTSLLETFKCNDCVIGTLEGHLFYLNPISGSVQTLNRQFTGCATAMDANEVINILCVGTSNSDAFCYDLDKKVLMMETKLHSFRTRSEQLFSKPLPISCLKYSKNGHYLCASQTDGSFWLMNPLTLTLYDYSIESDFPFKIIEFSPQNHFLALVDTSSCLWLYKISERSNLTLIGKCRRAHDTCVVAVMFDSASESDNSVALFSIGKDKRFVKYEVTMTGTQFVMKKILDIRIEQFAVPFSAMFHPSLSDTLIILNSQLKYRVFDLNKLAHIKTAQAPASSEPFTLLKGISDPNYIFYQVGKIAGIEKLPLDGNPYKASSMIVAGTRLSFTAFSHGGKCLLTNAERDKCVLMWKINLKIVDVMESVGGTALEPYYNLIEGGKDGSIMKDIKDYFIYSQILHSGEGVGDKRKVTNAIKACEVVNVMRALGYYPSEYEIQNLFHELGIFPEDRRNLEGTIDFATFVKLYLNHRPQFGVTAYLLNKSFKTLCLKANEKNSEMTKETFISTLMENGDCWAKKELFRVLWNLTLSSQGDDKMDKKEEAFIHELLPETVTFQYFFNELLGLTSDSDDLRLDDISSEYPSRLRKSTLKKVSFKIKKRNVSHVEK